MPSTPSIPFSTPQLQDRDTRILQQLTQTLQVAEKQVVSVLTLMGEGCTVPFIARYRKEATGGLNDEQLRLLEERKTYLEDLEKRRDSILESIAEQGKLTESLQQGILKATTKTELEDLYLPYRPKRQTKAQKAREAGLQPLAELLLSQPQKTPEACAQGYINPEQGVETLEAALEGASHIVVEQFSESAELMQQIRPWYLRQAVLHSSVVKGKEQDGEKFRDYFQYQEPLHKVPSHRALAMFRGKKEGVLRVSVKLGTQTVEQDNNRQWAENLVARYSGWEKANSPVDSWIESCVTLAWKDKVKPHLENEALADLREQAEEEAIKVFAKNLKDLLMAAPAGAKTTMGLDPGFRTGVKTAIVSTTGKVLKTTAIFPHKPQNDWDESIAELAALAKAHHVELIAIGNGTASRETDRLAQELIKKHPELKLTKIVVSEAGASVYSASELAGKELPTLDVTMRGAVSIARRLQDPLAELVKIDPKAIGVGQYQHDVNQKSLGRMLDAVVQDAVNAVGVDLNSASASLLTYVAGLSETLAKNIVDYRDANGSFATRQDLLEVPKLGPKAFEQAAGFLRITGGKNPLDASAVHPEAYPVVQQILRETHKPIQGLIGNVELLRSLNAEAYTSEQFGLPTIKDILTELEKPGRDPRPEFKTATFQEGVETISDLKPGMVLEGVVTNITNFGAFVDIGVHQDGLVHISQLATRFVKDPHAVVKTGQMVKVKVLDVDPPRKRIGLSMSQVEASS